MSDRILGAVCVVTAVAMAWATRGYVAPYSYEPLGPRAFPLLLAVCMGLSGLWLLLRPAAGSTAFHGVPWKGTLVCCGAVMVYAVLFQSLGFILATVLMSFPVGMAFGGNWKQSLGAGVGLGVGFHFLFDKLLDVTMPGGLLSSLL
jgi:putative tricarboxylic transport membrane protein